jgi:hypothetical protein
MISFFVAIYFAMNIIFVTIYFAMAISAVTIYFADTGFFFNNIFCND